MPHTHMPHYTLHIHNTWRGIERKTPPPLPYIYNLAMLNFDFLVPWCLIVTDMPRKKRGLLHHLTSNNPLDKKQSEQWYHLKDIMEALKCVLTSLVVLTLLALYMLTVSPPSAFVAHPKPGLVTNSILFSRLSRIILEKRVLYKQTIQVCANSVYGVLGLPSQAYDTWQCPLLSVVLEVMYEARLWALVSAQTANQGYKLVTN